MVRFIYGDHGTGKTEYVFKELEKAASLHKKAFLIVPEQMTVSAERNLLKKLPPSAQLHIEVLNFSRLANKFFRINGGLAYHVASPAFKTLIMMKAIKTTAPFLCEYKRTGNDDRSLANAMLLTYKELCASGISLKDIDSIAESTNNSILSGKLRDISTVCSVYEALIDEKYTDTNNELSRFAESVKSTNFFSDTELYFDSFTSFTGVEHDIIRSCVSQSPCVTFSIGIPDPIYNGIDTVSLKRCSDRLRKDCASLGKKIEIIKLHKNLRTSSPELSELSENLWTITRDDREFRYSNSIELIRAADIYDECEMAASRSRSFAEQGYKYGDIVIVARNAEKYRGIIEPALDNMELPYFLSEKSDPSLCPVSKLILSALRVANYGWRRNDVISHLKSGLCGIPPRESDIFECYTAKWNINGSKFTSEESWNMNPDGYTAELSVRGSNVLKITNSVKDKLIGGLKIYISELKASQTYADLCKATVHYLEVLNVRATLIDMSADFLMKGKAKEAGEYARMYDIVLDALDCVCDAMSDDPVDCSYFALLVHTALSESELGSIPTSQDEIIIGSADMLRADNVKCAIILGACDGEFPANTQSSGLLTDSERDYLIDHDFPLSGDSELRASDELYYFRRALSVPSDRLIVFTRADSEPSIAFTRIKNILGDKNVVETTDELLPRLKTRAAALEYLRLLEGSETGEALRIVLNKQNDDNQVALTAENDVIDPNTINKLLGNRLFLSQSKIDTFVNCKFAYTCKYLLKLDDAKRAQFSYNNIGTFVHHVLEKVLYRIFVINKGIYPDKNERERLVNEIISDYIKSMLPDKHARSARLRHLFVRLKITSSILIDDLLEEFTDSDFKPEFFELKIGSIDVPSIDYNLNNGTKMTLNGIVDRVDVFRDSDNAYLRVVDYKTGSKTFSVSDISEGLNLQLPLYLFSLVKNEDSAFTRALGSIPQIGGITYISAPQGKVKVQRFSCEDEAYRASVNEIRRSGLILDNPNVIKAISHSDNKRYLMASSRTNSLISSDGMEQLRNQLDSILTDIGNEIVSGFAHASAKEGSRACEYCLYSHVCRSSKKER